MLFPDITCTLQESLQINSSVGIYDLVAADFVLVVTMHKTTRKITINERLYSNEADEVIVMQFLEDNLDNIINGTIYSNYAFRNYCFHMTSNKSAKTFIAFTLLCKKDSFFLEKDIKWIDAYGMLNQKRVLKINEVSQEKSFYENIFTGNGLAIIGLSSSGKILKANPTAIKLFNIDPIENTDIYRLNWPDELLDAVNKTILSKEKQYLHKLTLLQINCDLVLDVVISPLEDGKGKKRGVIVVAYDITESQILTHEIEQLRHYGLLGEISAGLSHDIKNSLMSIRGCAKRMGSEQTLNDSLCSIILHESERLNEVINQMLAFGNIPQTIETASIDLNEVLNNCTQIIERQKFMKNVDIVLILDDGLPLINASISLMQQLFLNLLLNALQAIESSGTIKISSRYDPALEQIRILIEDNGTGIPSSNKEKIFNPNFTTKKYGTGMGLTIVKRTLERYGGNIKIKSEEGKGTRCKIVFDNKREVLA